MFDRRLLAKLSRCAWELLNLYSTQAFSCQDAKAGSAIAVQSFGGPHNFHPHLHQPATDGGSYNDDASKACPPPNTGDLEALVCHEGFKMLKAEGKIKDGTTTKTFDALDLNIHHMKPDSACL
jgi:hypothetical protein